MNNDRFSITESDLDKTKRVVEAHLQAFTFPMDSYLEFRLRTSRIYEIAYDGRQIGYAGFHEKVLSFFHILTEWADLAPKILERLITEHHVKRVYVNTQDPLLVALISEWEYEKKIDSCWFIDGQNKERTRKTVDGAAIRLAAADEVQKIARATDPFFDSLEERVAEQSIFVVEKGNELMGCGLIERGEFYKDCVSIGMVTCKEYRHRGIGQYVLWYLKDWAYEHGYKPVAGCSYHNALSRKTLEKAGMVVIGIGYEAILTGIE